MGEYEKMRNRRTLTAYKEPIRVTPSL